MSDGRGPAGIAWLGSACDTTSGYQMNINEVYNNLQATAEIFVHELGHNLGMEWVKDRSILKGSVHKRPRSCMTLSLREALPKKKVTKLRTFPYEGGGFNPIP